MEWKQKIIALNENEHLKQHLGTFVRKILFPVLIMFYFILTEKDFIKDFSDQFTIMGPGEYIFLSSHVILVYFLMPLVSFSELFVFLGGQSFNFTYLFFSFISRTLSVLLVLAALGKIVFELYS